MFAELSWSVHQPSLKMEAHQSQQITDKEQRNKNLSAGARGGAPIVGLLVFGGALAVSGLIAVASFVTNKYKSKPAPNKPQQSESDHPSQGIPSLQDSSTNLDNACYETSNTSKDQVPSCESLPTQTPILVEDKPDLQVETYVEEESMTSLHQEIVLSDDSPPESTVSFNDNGTEEEGLETSADSPGFEEVNQSEPQEPLKSIEIIVGATNETEAEDEEDDDVDFETCENSSEATRRTSQQVKGEMVNDQIEAKGTGESNMCRTDDKSHSGAIVSEFSGSSEKPDLNVAVNNHVSVSKFKTWVILLLLFAILLPVLLTHRN